MAIQSRRGKYSDFDPNRLLPGEWAVVQSGHPDAEDGEAVYMAFSAGSVKRMATHEDVKKEVELSTQEIAEELAAEFEADITTDIQAAQTAASNANTAATRASNSAAQAAQSAAAFTVDKTLTVSDKAADAKTVGDQLSTLKEDLSSAIGNTVIAISSIWEIGSINTQTGVNTSNNTRIRTKEFIDISNFESVRFVISEGYKYWWYLYDAEGTLLRQRQVWATSDTEINSVIIGSAVQMRIVMSNTSDTAASADYAQYLALTGVSKLKAIVDGTAEIANSIDHTMGVDIEETVSDVQQHFYFAPFKQGDTLQVSVTWTFTGSGDKNVNIKDDTGAIIKVIYSQGVYKFELPRDSKYIIVTLAKVSTVTEFTATYSIKSGMTLTLDSMYSDYQHTYCVEKDGTGDFTRLTDAIREACRYMDSVVYVGDGTWDLIAELGNEIYDISSSNWGLYLSNRVHIIFSSNSKVTANYTGSNANVLKYFSPFNTGKYGFTLENAT